MASDTIVLSELARLVALAPAGFAIALHARFATPRYLFQTYPDAWLEEYGRDGLMASDPTIRWAFAQTGSITWAELEEGDEDQVILRAARHGLAHGVTVSVVREGSRSLASFARSDRSFSAEERLQLEAGLVALHEATTSERPLSKEVREKLRHLAVTSTHP